MNKSEHLVYEHFVRKIAYIQALSDDNINHFLQNQRIQSLAIYGMGESGRTLLDRMSSAGVHIAYGIDRNAACYVAGLEVYGMEDELPPVDMVLVTPEQYFASIQEKLQEKGMRRVVRASEFLEEMLVYGE